MLAHGVDLADRCAGAQQRAGHLLLLCERDAVRRRDPVRRASARQQHQDQVAGGGARCQRQGVVGGLEAGLVGHRMSGLDHRDAAGRHGMAVPRGGEADETRRIESRAVEVVALGGCRHGGGALAGGQHDQPPLRWWRQMLRENGIRMRRGDGGIENGAQQFAFVGHVRWRLRQRNERNRLSDRLRKKKTPAARAGVPGFGWCGS